MGAKEAIVCVDDDVIILMSLKRELERQFKDRFLVETSLSAKEALDAVEDLCAQGIRVLLILTDWLMPGMKGDRLVAAVKESHPGIKCILISGQIDKNAIAETGMDRLIDSFVAKPWRSEQLIESVRRCLS
jgi:DNA-binding NtrC family response regulator